MIEESDKIIKESGQTLMSGRKSNIYSSQNRQHLRFFPDNIIEFGLFFLILFTPLAFGSVYVWAFSIMEIIVLLLLIILIFTKCWIQGSKISFPLFFPIIAFLALILFQMIPFSPPGMKLLSPKTYELYSETLDGYPERMKEDGGERQIIEGTQPIGQRVEFGGKTLDTKNTRGFFENWRTISVDPYSTRTELLKIISYLGVFLLIINYVDSKRKLMRMSTVIFFSGIVVALLGIAQKVAEAPKIYWFWEPIFKKDASFFGSFVNPNHFAGYMEMVIPIAIGLLIWQWRNWLRSQPGGFREFFINIGSEKGCKLILFSFLVILMVGALFLSRSRGGVISFLGSMVFLLFMVSKRERGRRILLILLGLLICIFSFLIWMGIRPLLEEFYTIQDVSRDYDVQYRFQNWRDATNIVRGFPLFGVGSGTFASIFPKFKTSSLQYFYLYLENDYLQLLCEMGIVGFGFFLWFTLGFFRQIESRNLKHHGIRGNSIQYISSYGCSTSVVAILIHSFWDFNMHIPSNSLLLSMIMGLAIAGIRVGAREYLEYYRERSF